MAKQKFYAVQVGKTPGVYHDWASCEAQVKGFPGAKYKAFSTETEAQAFAFPEKTAQSVTPETKQSKADARAKDETLPQPDEHTLVAYVDGSFYDGRYAFGCIFYEKGKAPIIQYGGGSNPELAAHRNVTGEMLGSLQAAKTAVLNGYENLAIVYDYAGIEQWATGGWKTNTPATRDYKAQMQGLQDKINIQFVKVKGHTGCEGNELADKAAKQGLKSDSIPQLLNLETEKPFDVDTQKKIPGCVKKLLAEAEYIEQNSGNNCQMQM